MSTALASRLSGITANLHVAVTFPFSFKVSSELAKSRVSAYPVRMSRTIQLGEICDMLDVGLRDARYVLEQGYIPKGVTESPESGNYRQFGPGQAFWLGMVLKLKAVGIKVQLAATIADYAVHSLRGITQNLNWDWRFLPESGRFDTDHQYYVDVGDLKYVRFVTNANPSMGGKLEEFPWKTINRKRTASEDARPCVTIRLDLTQIAGLLADAFRQEPG